MLILSSFYSFFEIFHELIHRTKLHIHNCETLKFSVLEQRLKLSKLLHTCYLFSSYLIFQSIQYCQFFSHHFSKHSSTSIIFQPTLVSRFLVSPFHLLSTPSSLLTTRNVAAIFGSVRFRSRPYWTRRWPEKRSRNSRPRRNFSPLRFHDCARGLGLFVAPRNERRNRIVHVCMCMCRRRGWRNNEEGGGRRIRARELSRLMVVDVVVFNLGKVSSVEILLNFRSFPTLMKVS